MPRNFRGDGPSRLLKLALGRQSAGQEARWIREALRERNGRVTLGQGDVHKELSDMIKRRARGAPLAYVIGNQPFGPLTLTVRAPTLIPRPETEDWTTRLSTRLSPATSSPINILDLCTGSGCIPLLLCHLWPPGSTRAVAVDISDEAVSLASENAQIYSMSTAENGTAQRNSIQIYQGDLMDPSFPSSLLSHRPESRPFDLITCNPPYIPKVEYDILPHSVRDHEDKRALLAEENGDGLSFYRKLVRILSDDKVGSERDGSSRLVAQNAMVAVEHGGGQSEAVQDIFMGERGLFSGTEAWKDQWGKFRVVVGVLA